MRAFALFIAVGLMLKPIPVAAAEFEILDPRPIGFDRIAAGECTLRLTGQITPADGMKITRAIEEERLIPIRSTDLYINFPNGLPVGHALCLESNGGSFSGGIALAETLIENAIATVIEPEKACLSACAVAFMAGTMGSSNSDGGSRMPYRVMDLTAQLGFHAPYVNFDRLGKSIPPEVAEESFRTALSTMVLITETLQGQDLFAATERFPKALLLEMLNTYGADRFSYVDTLDEAGLYDIKLTGVPEIGLDEGSWPRLCANLTGWATGRRTNPWAPDLPSWSYQVNDLQSGLNPEAPMPETLLRLDWADDLPEPDPAAIFRQVSSRHERCTIYAHKGAGDDYSVYLRANGEQLQTTFRSAEPWQTLPVTTDFSTLAAYTALPAGALRTLYPENSLIELATKAIAFPRFAPQQIWAFAPPPEGTANFDFIYLGADNRASLAAGMLPDRLEIRIVPYRLVDAELCIDDTAPFCLSVEIPDAPAPQVRILGPNVPETLRPVLYMRPDAKIGEN